jgi:hypothetical protein
MAQCEIEFDPDAQGHHLKLFFNPEAFDQDQYCERAFLRLQAYADIDIDLFRNAGEKTDDLLYLIRTIASGEAECTLSDFFFAIELCCEIEGSLDQLYDKAMEQLYTRLVNQYNHLVDTNTGTESDFQVLEARIKASQTMVSEIEECVSYIKYAAHQHQCKLGRFEVKKQLPIPNNIISLARFAFCS